MLGTGHGARYNFPISWSHDSKWIAFTERLDNANNVIFVFDMEENEKHQLTSGFYEDNFPVFSTDGKYLFYLTNRNMNVAYSGLDDGTWIYPNATQIAALSLTPKSKSVLAPKNDEVEIKEEKKEAEKNGKENKENRETESENGENEKNAKRKQ